MAEATCQRCRDLLSEGLNLCARARQMDSIDRRNAALSWARDGDEWQKSGQFDRYVERHNAMRPDVPIATRSATVHLWMQEQYDSDLAKWERDARHHLMQGCQL